MLEKRLKNSVNLKVEALLHLGVGAHQQVQHAKQMNNFVQNSIHFQGYILPSRHSGFFLWKIRYLNNLLANYFPEIYFSFVQ